MKYKLTHTAGRGCAGRARRGFTLVELLIAIAIIGIMIGMVLYTLAGAQRDSLTARTQGTIKKINDIILNRWEEFRYRAVKINIPEEYLVPLDMGSGAISTPLSPREGARMRMVILRDMMRMEFPDHYSDLAYTPTQYMCALYTADNVAPYTNTTTDKTLLLDRTVSSTYNTYRKRVGLPSLPGSLTNTLPVSFAALPTNPTIDNEQAELLYMIVAHTNINGANGLEFFRPSEIGDTDADGFPEFIDGWQRPIAWLRWPAGYGVVDATLSATDQAKALPVDAMINDVAVPDPMDPLKTDWRWSHPAYSAVPKPWMLIPLIVSAGPDGVFDLNFGSGAAAPTPVALHQWTIGGTGSTAHISPYYFPDPYNGFYGSSGGSATAYQGGLGNWQNDDGDPTTFGTPDNITNYSLLLE